MFVVLVKTVNAIKCDVCHVGLFNNNLLFKIHY